MNETALKKRLTALARGERQPNAPVVEAYLADEAAREAAQALRRTTDLYYLNRTPLWPPSSCLPPLD